MTYTQTLYTCKSCMKQKESPIAELIDICYECVKSKQPGGEFTNYVLRPVGYTVPTKKEDDGK